MTNGSGIQGVWDFETALAQMRRALTIVGQAGDDSSEAPFIRVSDFETALAQNAARATSVGQAGDDSSEAPLGR